MKNIRREPCVGWMIVSFMVLFFIIGCVSHSFQTVFFKIILLALSLWFFFIFPCLWEKSVSSPMISRTVSRLLGLGSSSVGMIVSAVGC